MFSKSLYGIWTTERETLIFHVVRFTWRARDFVVGKNCRLTRANINKLKSMGLDDIIELVGRITTGLVLPAHFYDGLAEPVAEKMVGLQTRLHPRRKRKRFEGAAEILCREGLDSCAVPIYRALSRFTDFDLKTFSIENLFKSEALHRVFKNLL